MVADDGTLSDSIDSAYITGPARDNLLLEEDPRFSEAIRSPSQSTVLIYRCLDQAENQCIEGRLMTEGWKHNSLFHTLVNQARCFHVWPIVSSLLGYVV